MLSSSKFYEVFATFSFCYSRNKKQVTVHKLILTEIRMNMVSSHVFFNVEGSSIKKKNHNKKHTLMAGQNPQGFCMNSIEKTPSFVADLVSLLKFERWNETTISLSPLCGNLGSSGFTWGPNGHIHELRSFTRVHTVYMYQKQQISHRCIPDCRCSIPNTGIQYNTKTLVNSNWNQVSWTTQEVEWEEV